MKIFDFSKESIVVVITLSAMCLITGFFLSFEQNAYANMTIFLRLLYAIEISWFAFVWYVNAQLFFLPVYLALDQIFKKLESDFDVFFEALLAVSAALFAALCFAKYFEYIKFMDYICDLNQQCVRLD